MTHLRGHFNYWIFGLFLALQLPLAVADEGEAVRDACLRGEPKACFDFGQANYLAGEHDAAEKAFATGCRGGNGFSCYRWGDLLVLNDRNFVAAYAEAGRTLASACSAGEPESCELLKDAREGTHGDVNHRWTLKIRYWMDRLIHRFFPKS